MARGRQAFILTLDDDASVGAFIKEMLPTARYRTEWYCDVDAALAVIANDPPDLCLVDIDLSAGHTGWEFLSGLRAREATANTPVVMLTGMADTLNRERSLKLGADRYLVKPVAPDTLRRVVGEML